MKKDKKQTKAKKQEESSESTQEDMFKPTKDTQDLEFQIGSIEQEHFHQIKMLLGSFFKSQQYIDEIFEQADQISQLAESTDVIQTPELEVTGFCSYIPLMLLPEFKFMQLMTKQLQRFLDEKFIDKNNVAVVYNLKYVNLPPTISIDALHSMIQNQKWSQSKEYNDVVWPAAFFNVDYYVLFSKCKAGEDKKADLETLYHVELYDFKDCAEKVYITSKDQFDPEYQFNVFMLVKKAELEKIVLKMK
ncbi:p21-C-terminal_region-binding protein [Hexamita inflata]|uniref:P21-C-terminal region-binding protein n=1 Tax=Hexamita inflata TaxID=28002 RepID=A0AA86RFJ6_9EUKA|nr:p21-C-terminal region-binding protein [Hexamita inflata]CAI9971344.1 p21-C-terminal region-binding protein [Hexamita inflata]